MVLGARHRSCHCSERGVVRGGGKDQSGVLVSSVGVEVGVVVE